MKTDESQVRVEEFTALQNSGAPVIEISKLQKSFGSQEVLKNISLNLFEGENLVMLGKSGTGKSVIIKCIIGLLYGDGGQIKVFGKDITTMDRLEWIDLREKIGFLFQSGALYDSMTVKQNLEFPLRRLKNKYSEEEIVKKVNEVLEHVGLVHALNKMPSELSGGMRKRISLARTIVVDPLIMLYDEPTTGLDPVTSSEISALINEVRVRSKTSSIIITHDIKCANITADRVIMIEDGSVYLEDTVAGIQASNDPLVRAFYD